MKPDKYLESELNSIVNEDILPEEEKMLELKQLELFISKRLLSKKFRKNSLTDQTSKLFEKKLRYR